MIRRSNPYVPALPHVRTQYIQGPHIPVTPPPPPPPIPPVLISGTTYNDRYSGTGFAAVLDISGFGTTVSDASTGSYGFFVPSATSTTVTPVYAGGTFSPDSRTYVSLSGDQVGQNYAFWDETPIYAFTGSVFYSDGGVGVPGAIVEVNGGTITTDSFGSFGFSLYRGYSYDVIPHASNGSFDPAALSGVAENNTNLDFAFTRFAAVIFGEVRLDGAPVGAGDVGIVFDGDGQASTDASGSYTNTLYVGYTGTANPNYFNEWPEPYWTINPQVRVYTDIAGDVGGQDYDITTNFADIAGTFTPGQTVFVTNGTGTWQSNVATGSYGFSVMKGWSGTTQAIDWITDPDAYVYNSVSSNYIDQNFQLNAPFVMPADNYFDWSGWAFEVPDRWFIYARNPADLTYSVYATNAGTVFNILIADTGSYYHVTGVTVDSNQATLDSIDTYAAPPLPPVFTITGVLNVNGAPQANEGISFYPGSTFFTDINGTYTAIVSSPFTGISAPDNYGIPAFIFAPLIGTDPAYGTYGYASQTTPLDGQDFNITPFLAIIEGTITDASTGSGFSVPLVFTSGTGTVMTDASGSYSIHGHYGWVTTATPYYAGGTFDPAFRSYNLLGGNEYFNQNYTFYPNPPEAFLISGFMTQSQNGSGFSGTLAVDGVTGSVYPDATTGSYGVLVPSGYSGTIVPSHCAVPFSGEYVPAQLVYTNIGSDIPNQDYRLNAVTDIQSLDWGNSFVFINGTPLSGTIGVAGTGWAQGTYGTFWSYGYQDGTEAFNQCFAFFDTTLVNFEAPYTVRITCVYTGSQYTDNLSGGYSSTDQVSAEINGSNTQFATFFNGSFGGTLVQEATIGTGCNDLNTQWGNSLGAATVPPAYFFAEINGWFTVEIPVPPVPPSFFSAAVVTDAFTMGGFAAVPVEVIQDGSTAGTLTTDPTTGLTTSTATVQSGGTVDLVPHYFGGSFVPASYSYVVSSNKTVPFKFYGTEQTGCPIPVLTAIGDLPTPNNASRNVMDPINNLLWIIDESYTYVYYVDVVGGTFAGSVDVQSPFGCPSIAYEPINRKLVVSTYDGSVAFINPVTKATSLSNFKQRWPDFHNLCVDDFGTAYLIDIRNGGTLYAVDCNTELLVHRKTGLFSSDSICWASNIGQAVLNKGGFGARFALYDPNTQTFADSVITSTTSFNYENYYVKATGHVLMSRSGATGADIIDIAQGVNATILGNISETRVSDACEDTCTNRLFVSNGNYQVSEYTLDGTYLKWNTFDNAGAGLNPTGLAHSRATNLVYYEDWNDGTIKTLKATTSGTDILDALWIADPTVNGANTTGAVTPNGNFISSAIGNNGTISSQTFSTQTADYYQHFDQRWDTTFVNYGTAYAARVSVGLTGTQYQEDGAPYISNTADAFMINNGVYDAGLSFTSNGSFGGNYDFNFTVNAGLNTLRLQLDHYSGYSLSSPSWFFTQADGTFVISKP